MKQLRGSAIWFVILGCLLVQGVQAQTVMEGELAGDIDVYMTEVADSGFSGVILVAKDGEVILSKGYGLAYRDENIPVAHDSVFDILSITKQFTATAILQLEEQGKLSVNDPISKYFSGVTDAKKDITLHHLLTHTAGLVDILGDDYEVMERDELVASAMRTRLLHTPGETFSYSNLGYSLLAIIVEDVSGEPYETYLRDHLFEPAGMTMTGYVFPTWEPEKVVVLYEEEEGEFDAKGTPLEQIWAEDGPFWNLRGNGGILSTAGDMYKWHLALEGDGILSDSSKDKMFTRYVDETWDAADGYGYGWFVSESPRGTKIVHHSGYGLEGNSSEFRRFVEEGVVFFIATNVSNYDVYELDLSNEIANIIFETN